MRKKPKKTFFQACEDGDIERVKELKEQNFNINTLSVDRFTGLHYAAEAGHVDLVELLLSRYKAEVNTCGADGGIALHWACRTPDRADIIRKLLMSGANPNAQGKFGRAPIHVCATKGLSGNLSALLDYSKSIRIDISDNPHDQNRGTTALHLAVFHGNMDCVKVLMKAGAHAWVKNTKNQLPIHLACMQNNVEIVSLLVRSDTTSIKVTHAEDDLTAQDIDLRTPLMYACLYGNVDVVQFLVNIGKLGTDLPDIKLTAAYLAANKSLIDRTINLDLCNSKGETALHCAAEGGNKEIVEILLHPVQKGKGRVDVEHPQAHGYTPLHVACQHGHIEVAKSLLEYSADISARDNNGETPLMHAAAYGHVAMVHFMLNSGADQCNHDSSGETTMFHAVKENRVEVARYLLSVREADKTYSDSDKCSNTPLHLATQRGFCTCVSVLLENGYLLDVKNKVGFTPVHLAVKDGRNETLQVILEKDSKCVQYEDKQFNTPLHIAAKYGQAQCCRLLLAGGSTVNKQNIQGVSPLHLGAQAGSKPVCKLLLEHGADVNQLDNNEDSALHYSARGGDVGTAAVLLKHSCDLAQYNEQGDNALLTAIRNNNEQVIRTIISADNWKTSLSLNEADHVQGSRQEFPHKRDFLHLIDERKEDSDAKILHNPLHQLIIHCPEQAHAVFDRCTHAEDMVSEEKDDYWVQFDYSVIENNMTGVVHPFTTMLQHNRMELLSHPLISSLITHKWRSYGRNWYYINVLINALFVIFLTCYALLEVTPDTADTEYRNGALLSVLAIGVILFCVVRLIIEVLQAVRNTEQYISDINNYSELFVFVFSICFVCSAFTGDGPSYWQWEVGCFVTVIAWLNLIMCLKKLPYIGIYVIMIGINFHSFLKVLPSIFMFTIPFSLVFHMALGSTFGTFRQPGYAISKALIMFLGEINYDMYFVPISLEAENPVKYPWSTYILFHLFVFCLPIILMNLLIGIAVEDVALTLQRARLLRSAQRIDQIFLSEKLQFSGLYRITFPLDKLYPNKKLWFGGHYYDFRGKDISDIMSRKRQFEHDSGESLHRLQKSINKLISNQAQIKDRLNVVYKLLDNETAEQVSLDHIRFSNIRILDQE